MSLNTKIGIVTAAGYTEAERYYGRLHGLLEAIKSSDLLTDTQKHNLVVMGKPLVPLPYPKGTSLTFPGGESNFLFKYSLTSPYLLQHLPRRTWILPSMSTWTQARITSLLDLAESSLKECVSNLALPATILRKERAVGIIPKIAGYKFARESLEETVMVVQKKLEMSGAGKELPFCAFNGGNDVFVDIGDKSWGVLVCQNYFGILHETASLKPEEDCVQIRGDRTLHVGDQFLSAGSNDFKARVVGTTAWIASPTETVELLGELKEMIATQEERRRGEIEGKMTRDTLAFVDGLFRKFPMEKE